MVKRFVRGLSLILVFSTVMPPLYGMGRLKKAWSRFASSVKTGFSRFGFTGQWSNGFAKNSRLFSTFSQANRFSRLGGLTAAATLVAPLNTQPSAQTRRIEFSPAHIDAYGHVFKQKFIDLAKAHITTKDRNIINAIVHLLKKYPDVAQQLFPLVMQQCAQVDPAIQQAVGAQCLIATTQPQKSIVNDALKTAKDFITPSNAMQYIALPLVDEQHLLQTGELQLIPEHKMATAIASYALTDLLVWRVGQVATDVTGYSFGCPEYKDGQWNFGYYGCHAGKFVGKNMIVRPLVKSVLVDPLLGDSKK